MAPPSGCVCGGGGERGGFAVVEIPAHLLESIPAGSKSVENHSGLVSLHFLLFFLFCYFGTPLN